MFLCPITRRGKKKKSSSTNTEEKNINLGRITGSSSIETLVRVGIEKEHGLSPDSKMVVLHDFTPCVDDELEVKRGQVVNILYRENDWVYIIGQDSRQEGFIPHSYCAPYNTQLADLAIKKKLPRNVALGVVGGTVPIDNQTSDFSEIDNSTAGPVLGLVGLQTNLKHSQASLNSEPDFLPFSKDPSGRFIVLYTFIARDENDVSVERGEFVTVLNKEDPEWYWIVRSDGQEGFIPSGFVYSAENILQSGDTLGSNSANINSSSVANNSSNNGGNVFSLNNTATSNNGNVFSTANVNNSTTLTGQQQHPPGSDDLRYHGTELVMLYDYKAQAPDDLSVRRGEWIYADLNNQGVDGWLWAYAPKSSRKYGKYGFIPKAYARPPHQTSL
ncbi:unnamed protein product [Diamesa serratosioi]